MTRHVPWVLLLAAFVGRTSLPAVGDERILSAQTLHQQGVPSNLVLAGDSLVLARGVVIEDDGPASGYSYQPQVEKLTPDVRVRKELLVPRPTASAVRLLVAPGGELQLTLNGQETKLGEARKSGNYWQVYDLDPQLLKEGANQFVFAGKGQFWIARDDDYPAGSLERTRHPNRSARSTDGGQTWSDSQLGVGGDIDGEYYVRLFLDQFVPSGEVVSPIIDLRNLNDRPIAPAGGDIDADAVNVAISVDAHRPEKTEIVVEVRWASSQTSETTWSKWQPVDATTGGKLQGRVGRYLQTRVRLTSAEPLATPRLKAIRVHTALAAAPQIPSLRIVETDNRPLVRSSIPFQYEPFDEPRLQELREKFALDKIVEGASSELQEISRLAAWSATLWDKMHLKDSYPSWCALDILAPHPDGTLVGGFCQQRSLVFLQACESLGHVGRVVSIGPGDRVSTYRGGHETTEIWSNQFSKWIHVDGDNGWYFVDNETDEPLSFLELRERQLDHLAGKTPAATRCVRLAEQNQREWNSFADKPAFVELRLIPRSNFLEQKHPLPLNQGMRGWFWTGHYVWSDDREPTRPLYVHRVTRREDFEWDVNRTQILLTATDAPDALHVTLVTHTPGLKSFVKEANGDRANTQASFVWKLRRGRNELSVAAQNSAGRLGPPSRMIVEYQP